MSKAKRQTYTDRCESEAHRMHLVRGLVEMLHDMGLGKLVPFPLRPEDHKGRGVGDRGYVPLRKPANYGPALHSAVEAFAFFNYEDLPSEELCVRWLKELREGIYGGRSAKRQRGRRRSRQRKAA